MATLNNAILEAAFEDGLIGIKLTSNQKIYLENSIVTANLILQIVKDSDGLDIDQVANRAKLHPNTCLQFLRWLASKNFIRIASDEIKCKDGRKIRNLYEILCP